MNTISSVKIPASSTVTGRAKLETSDSAPQNPVDSLRKWERQQTHFEAEPISYQKAVARFQAVCDQIKAADQTPDDQDRRRGRVEIDNREMTAKLASDGYIYKVELEEKPTTGLAFLGELFLLTPERFGDRDRTQNFVARIHGDEFITVYDSVVRPDGETSKEDYTIYFADQSIGSYEKLK